MLPADATGPLIGEELAASQRVFVRTVLTAATERLSGQRPVSVDSTALR